VKSSRTREDAERAAPCDRRTFGLRIEDKVSAAVETLAPKLGLAHQSVVGL
jgi:hypothetical protein